MFKRILLAAALASASAAAFAQQQVDISGKDFLSGAGDARLADIARQAAAAGKKVVVTAPAYWQDKVNAKLHAGAANVSVQMSEGFFESVSVRIEDGKATAPKAEAPKAEAPKAEAPKAEAPAADAAKADAARAEAAKADAAKAEAAKAEAAKAEAAREEAARQEAARQEAARQEAARQEAARAEAAKAEAAKAEAAKAEAAKVEAAKAAEANRIAGIKQRLEKNLNEGKAAEGDIQPTQLQKDDLVFVDGDIRAVVRRNGAHTQLYWLQGDLNLDRIELIPDGNNRYKVLEPLRNVANPTLRTHETNIHFLANVPAPDAGERKSLQQQYAEGRDVVDVVHPTELREGDVIYTAKNAAIVVRRSGSTVVRLWLDGDLNLGQTGISKQSSNTYRVLSDTIK